MALMTFEYQGREVLSPKYDEVFKFVFLGRDKRPLASFLSAVLRREVSAGGLSSYSPELPKSHRQNRGVRLDIVVKLPDLSVINIEMQVDDEDNMAQRSVYSTALLLADQLRRGEDYSVTRPVIGINILDFDYLPNPNKYITRFRMKEVEDNIELSGGVLQEIIFIELSKLPETADDSELVWWIQFLSVETEEELDMIATKSPTMTKARDALVRANADKELRYEMMLRERQERTYISDMAESKRDGLAEGLARAHEEDAKKMIAKGVDNDFISDITGLSVGQINRLRHGGSI